VLSLSTAWFKDPALPTPAALAEVRRLGFGAIEWGISPLRINADQVAAAVAAGEISVSSIHAVAGFNAEAGIDPRGSHIGSPDDAKRSATIEALCRTVDLARRVGARAVVTHAGAIGGALAQGVAALVARYQAQGDSPDFRRELEELRPLRAAEAPDRLARTIDSLGEVVRRVGEFPIAVEVHYYYSSLPHPDELQAMFDALGPWLGYWHDCGHARMMEIFAGVPEMSWLDRFRDRLLGVHIHDMIRTADHQPPGQGGLDLAGVAARVAGHPCVRVVELSSNWSAEQVMAGRLHVEKIGLI
jgi:sugar phosphate isomerase/epimerase